MRNFGLTSTLISQSRRLIYICIYFSCQFFRVLSNSNRSICPSSNFPVCKTYRLSSIYNYKVSASLYRCIHPHKHLSILFNLRCFNYFFSSLYWRWVDAHFPLFKYAYNLPSHILLSHISSLSETLVHNVEYIWVNVMWIRSWEWETDRKSVV